MAEDLALISKVILALITGSLVAAAIFPSNRLPGELWTYASDAMGFTYTAAWSISFYPQIFLNYKRRSVVGLSLDFQVLNLLGFFCYATYNTALLFVPVVQEQYHKSIGPNIPVGVEDVAFSVHAFVITALTLAQCIVYERGEQRFDTLIGKFAMWAAGGAAAASVAVAIAQVQEDAVPYLTWINLLLALSAVKMVVSLIKYIPQVVLNMERKSTEGWSVFNVLLDLLGGVLSLAQLLLQCAVLNDWRQIAGNPVKFGLGIVSLSFDIIFMLQHYVLYASRGQVSQGDAITLLDEDLDGAE